MSPTRRAKMTETLDAASRGKRHVKKETVNAASRGNECLEISRRVEDVLEMRSRYLSTPKFVDRGGVRRALQADDIEYLVSRLLFVDVAKKRRQQ